MNALIVLGNQLFDPTLLDGQVPEDSLEVFMREDFELCTYFKFHKQKIVFFLAAMRTYAEELEKSGLKVHYETLSQSRDPYEKHLGNWLTRRKIKKAFLFEIEDKFFEGRILSLLKSLGIEHEVMPSPMFLTSRADFGAYLGKTRHPFMKTFYESQRKRLKILVDDRLEPAGGSWSFDQDNRLSLPASITPPPVTITRRKSKHVDEVTDLCEKHFADHPGSAAGFWLPVDREGAREWLQLFLKERLADFGPYEDAIPPSSDFVFHSVLTPFLNTGLLTPSEVVKTTLRFAQKNKTPLNSLEGFIRQIIGWREFVRGIYRHYSEKQDTTNFWNHRKKLASCWYDGKTGIPPLDHALVKTLRYGYCHHIERLMVIGSLMLLLEVDPTEAHRWFMEMFIDSSDWVMGPNVYGMALFSDGGIFATKPYICGSNYYRKMGGYKKADWCDGVDGLYWQFIEKHKAFFLKNPRLSMMARTLEKMDVAKKQRLFEAADQLRCKLVR
jgi:deoxyribodipyrimidine photolyase-related protein